MEIEYGSVRRAFGLVSSVLLWTLIAGCPAAEPPPAGPFVSHAAQLKVELLRMPSAQRLAVKVEEAPEGAHVLAESGQGGCNGDWLHRAHAACVAHRRAHHGDKNCTVVFHYSEGTCSLP